MNDVGGGVNISFMWQATIVWNQLRTNFSHDSGMTRSQHPISQLDTPCIDLLE